MQEVERGFGLQWDDAPIVSEVPLGDAPRASRTAGPVSLCPRLPVRDQRSTQSCTWQALTRAARMARIARGLPDEGDYSALAGYALTRILQGDPSYLVARGEYALRADEGARTSKVFEAAIKFGFVLEDVWPFDEGKIFDVPRLSEIVEGDARRLRVTAWEPISASSIGDALAALLGVTIAIRVDWPFVRNRGETVRSFDGPVAGNHMMAIRAWDEEAITIVNSYGPDFGDEGEVRVTHEALRSSALLGVFAFDPSEWRSE